MAWGVYDYPEPKWKKEKTCPMCGEVCDIFYVRELSGDIAGCNVCLREVYADDMDEG